MSNPAPTLNQINAFNATQGTTIDFNIIGGTEVIRSNKIYIYDLSDNSLICTHLYVSTESIHELPPNTSSSIVYASGKSSADFTNNTQYYAQIQTFTDVGGTQGGSGLSIAKLFWCLPTPTLTLSTIPTTISTTSYNVSATYTPNTSGGATNEVQEFQFNLYSAIGALLQTSGVVLYGEGVDLSYNFSGLEVDSTYYVTLDVTTTQGMNVSVQSNTFTVSIDTPTMGSASVVNNGCDGYISVTSNLSSEYEHEESVDSGEIMSFTTDSVNDITELDVDFSPVQDGTPWMSTQDTKPYTFRVVPTQTEDFGHESDTLVGGSVVWHQLLTGGKGDSATGWSGIRCTITSNGEELTATCAGTGFATASKGFAQSPVGHAYLVSFDAKVSATNITLGGSLSSNSIGTNYFLSNYAFASANTWERIARVIVPTDDSVALFRLGTGNATANQTFSFKNVQIFDLTKMFGSIIANRVYTMEQATAGSGIAWLKSYGFFTDSYYAYATPSIESVEATKHITTGKNLLPMTVSRIKSENTSGGTWNGNVFTSSGCTYELLTEDGNNVTGIKVNGTSTANNVLWLGSFNYIAGASVKINSGVTTGSIDVFFRMSGSGKGVYTYQFNSYGTDKTISGTTNMELWGNIRVDNGKTLNNMIFKPSLVFSENTTDFEPYIAHEYTLDSDLVLRGVSKLDASNNLYYDGDIYESDGSVTRKYSQGTISVTSVYTHPNNNVVDFAVFATSSIYAQPLSIFGEKINSVATTYGSITTNGVAVIFNASTKLVAVSIPKGTSLADAQTLLNGSAYVYELATSTNEFADPYTNPQIVDPHGTEEYVGSPIPVGHKTTYQRICPINGWDSVEVDVVGKNIFDGSNIVVGSISTTDGSDAVNANQSRTQNYMAIKGGEIYTVSGIGASARFHEYKADGTYIGNTLRSNGSYTPNELCAKIRIAGSTSWVTSNIMIRLASVSDATYEPYNGTTYTSTFPKYKQQVAQDKIPYVTKNIGDTYADTLTENLVGGTIAWNQSVPDTTTTHTISGSIASMDDAVAGNFESVVCDIKPLQNLHGYDKPWVGGAGKNKLGISGSSITSNGITFTLQSDGTIKATGTLTGSSASAYFTASIPTGSYIFSDSVNGSASTYWTQIVDDSNWSGVSTSGSDVNFSIATNNVRVYVATKQSPPTGGIVFKPMMRLSGTDNTWQPWENLCPITGFTGCEVDVSGANLIKVSADSYDNSQACTSTVTDSGIAVTATGNYARRMDAFNVVVGQTYTLSFKGKSTGNNNNVYFCKSANWNDRYGLQALTATETEYTYTFTATTSVFAIGFYVTSNSSSGEMTITDLQLERGSTATDYVPYNPNSAVYNITWQTEAGAVYGGTVDVVSGVLTVTHAKFKLSDCANGSYVSGSQVFGFQFNSLNINTNRTATGVQGCISDTFANYYTGNSISLGSIPNGSFCVNLTAMSSGNSTITLKDTNYTTATDILNAYENAVFVVPLTTPTTYQLDPVQVACLLGHNNVWNNIADTIVTYPTNHSYQSLSTTHKYYKRINGVESISVGSDVVADVGTDNIIDLTQMFGTTIADYIYNIEQSSSSGMGVKFFKSLFPSNDYDYNSGELISVNASAHVIKDANGNVVHTYPLDSDLVLRGVPKLDANNKLYYDGDVYNPNGSVTRKYGIVDLGTLTWTSDSGGFRTSISGRKYTSDDTYGRINYVLPLPYIYQYALTDDKTIAFSKVNTNIWIKDSSYANATAFKTAMSGVYFVYELATPTTEQADPFEENQAIISNGIEEYVVTEQGDVEMPVGHDSTYYTTAIYSGTIDMAKGVLTINMVSVDLGTLNWTYRTTSTVPFFFASIAGMVLKGKLTSDRYVQTTLLPNNANFPNGGISNNSYFVTPTNVMIRDDGFTDSTSFKTAVTGSKLVYELATPIEISLTPQQIQTLSGQNNIWSNTNGGMSLVYQLPITSLLVKRRDVADVSGKWLTLYSIPITQASDMDFTFIDFLNQYGKTYQYALVPVLAQDQSGVVVQIEGGYTVSDNVDSIFDGVYIADQTNVERVKAGVGYGNIDMNQGVGSITPIGSKYPIVITNSQNQYHNGSIRGTIVPNDFYSNGNLSRIDMVNKRDELEQFLTNKRAKIIKDWNGKMWLVMIMSNVSCSFDDNYGMGMVSFSADWLEVGDPTNQQDLYNAGLINVGGV